MAGKSTYNTIDAVERAMKVFDTVANQTSPIDGKTVAELTELPYGTVMGYIATFLKTGHIEKAGDGYLQSQKIGVMWAKRVAIVKSNLNKYTQDLQELEA